MAVSLTCSLCPPAYSAPSHPNPSRGLQPVFCRCRGNRQLYRPFTGFFTDIFLTFTASGNFSVMGNKVVTFTEQQLEDYQVTLVVRLCSEFEKLFFAKFVFGICDVCLFFFLLTFGMYGLLEFDNSLSF